jgi:hypothetical protein
MPDGRVGEVFATAEANFDDSEQKVVVQLDGHVCPEDASDPMHHYRPEWIPAAETVRVGGDVHECSEIARDVFHSWVRRVIDAVPG